MAGGARRGRHVGDQDQGDGERGQAEWRQPSGPAEDPASHGPDDAKTEAGQADGGVIG